MSLSKKINKWLPISIGATVALMVGVFWIAGPTEVLNRLRDLPPATLASIFAFLLTIPLWTAFRFWRILNHFSIEIPWRAALRATVSGQIASLVVVPLFGQVVGRQAMLNSLGVSPASNAALAAYERISVAVISGVSASAGAVYLLNSAELNKMLLSISLIPVIIAIAAGLYISITFDVSAFERNAYSRLSQASNVRRIAEVFATSFGSYAAMLVCFVAGFHTIAPSIDYWHLAAASAIISFAASMPISLGGWGLRELAAIYVFGKLGVAASDAVAVAVMIGLLSTFALISYSPIFAFKTDLPSNLKSRVNNIQNNFFIEKIATWGIGIAVAVLIFFNLHLSFEHGSTNINLADPFAILAFAAVCLQCVHDRKAPVWRVAGVNRLLIAFTLMWLFGLVWGAKSIGLTQWALVGRFFGWFILLGYLATGYLIVSTHGRQGLRRLIETMSAVGASVVLVHAALRLSAPVFNLDYVIPANFEGFSQNRNAFAFQMLCLIALSIGYSRTSEKLLTPRRISQSNVYGITIGLAILGIMLSGSRTGIITFAIILTTSLVFGLGNKCLMVKAIVTAALLWAIGWVINYLMHIGLASGQLDLSNLQASMSSEASDQGRWAANLLGLKLWLTSPIAGIGMGVFLEKSVFAFGFPIIIHSTPIWLLTEFGLFGLGIMFYTIYIFVSHLRSSKASMPSDKALLLLIVAFVFFCQLHEILFQRILWFTIGALMALPKVRRGDINL